MVIDLLMSQAVTAKSMVVLLIGCIAGAIVWFCYPKGTNKDYNR